MFVLLDLSTILPREGVCEGVLSPCAVFNQEVESGEELGLTGLARRQLLSRYKVFKRFVVGVHSKPLMQL